MKNPNDFIDRLWLLRMHRWAQRGLKFLAKDQIEEAVDQRPRRRRFAVGICADMAGWPLELRWASGRAGGLKSVSR
jgi:hypothetical protein